MPKLQYKAIKIECEGKKYENSSSLYFQLKILKLQELFKVEIAKIVYNFLHAGLPSPFAGIFIKTCTVSKRQNRSFINPNNLYIPRLRSTKLLRSTKFQGVMLWNSIPLKIQNLSKFALKTSQRILNRVVSINHVKFLSSLSQTDSITLYCLLLHCNRLGGCLTR